MRQVRERAEEEAQRRTADILREGEQMKYKVGDKVRVRQWEDMEKEYGSNASGYIYIESCKNTFTEGMSKYCGNVLTIREIRGRTYRMNEVKFNWSDEMLEPVVDEIKDSGERTTFDTGAVRDMHAGKGRMDLLPLHAILKLSEHCEKGAIKYEEHNVDKGIPQHSLIDSGMRHLFKYAAGYTDEDHLIAAMWNIAWAVNQRKTHPELIDIPWKGEKK